KGEIRRCRRVAYWRVSDLREAMDHFIAHGCTLYRGPIVGIDGQSVCQVRDVHGNVWGIVENR
ncbi:Var1, partial [mine drainage metagenome]